MARKVDKKVSGGHGSAVQKKAERKSVTSHARPSSPGPASAPPYFNMLTPVQQRTVRRNIIHVLRSGGFLGRGKYDPVTRDVPLRERLYAETGGEEEALTHDERNRLIALVRNLSRNSDHLNGFLTQLELNVVGTNGGKASFEFPVEFTDSARELRAAFGEWARECEFFDGATLQQLLKLALRTKYVTGRAVLLFDDGIIADTGKIVVFEGDAVANIPDVEFKKRFPDGWSQHQGLLKDEIGRTRGAICSMSQRGRTTFDKLVDERGRILVWPLVKAADVNWIDSPFVIFQNLRRVNQIVGVPGIASSVGSIMDLEDLTKFELQTAKKSSQTFASVSRQEDAPPQRLTDGLDPSATAPLDSSATDGEVEAAVADVVEGADDMEFTVTEGAATIYEILPKGLKMDVLSPVHPNTNVATMVTWIKQNASWANGIASLFATGKADGSYSASLVEQAITWPKFEDEQQLMKTGILDWLVRRWAAWAVRKGIISPSLRLPENWIRRVAYSFPVKREPDAQKEQSAIKSSLQNRTTSLRKLLGPDWREEIDCIAEESAYCREKGITHPGDITVSGQVIEDPDAQNKKETEE